MADTPEVKVQITGDASGAVAAMRQAADATRDSVQGMRESLTSIDSAFDSIRTAYLKIAAVIGSVKLFKDVIDETVAMTTESQALGRQFGITAAEASVLRVALGDIYVSQEQFAAAGNKISLSLRTNEKAFTDVGIATRDASGNFRSLIDIMADVNAHLADTKAGTDRNVEAAKFYGRSWGEVAPILRLTADGMEQARAKAAELGLVVGPESEAAVNTYRAAMNDVGDVLAGITKSIGEGLLPMLTATADWFKQTGPAAINGTRTAVAGLVDVLRSLFSALGSVVDALLTVGRAFGSSLTGAELFRNMLAVVALAAEAFSVAVRVAFEALGAVIESVVLTFRQLGDGAKAVFAAVSGEGSWSDVAAAWSRGAGRIEEAARRHQDNLKAILSESGQKMQAIAMGDLGRSGPAAATPGAADTSMPAGTESASASGAGPSRMSEWQGELDAKKAAYITSQTAINSLREYSKQQEIADWQQIAAAHKLSREEQLAIETKVAKLGRDILADNTERQLADLKDQENALRFSYDARLEIASQAMAKIAATYGEDSAKYRAQVNLIVELQRQKAAQLAAIELQSLAARQAIRQAELDDEQAAAERRVAMGMMTQRDLIAIERGIADQRYALQRDLLQKQVEAEQMGPNNPERLGALNDQLLALESEHARNVAAIDRASIEERVQYFTQFYESIKSGFASTIAGFLKGTMSIGATVREMFKSIADSVIAIMAQIAAQWIAQQIMQRFAAKLFTQSTITSKAAEAGAGGVASMAAAPFPINLSAPAFGAAMFGSALAYQGMALASAAGGYDIPSGVNPITQLHANEMVLPANLADAVRSMAGGGGGGGQGAGVRVVNVIDPSIAKDWMQSAAGEKVVMNVLRRNPGAIRQILA